MRPVSYLGLDWDISLRHNYDVIGYHVRLRREKLGWSQAQLGAKAGVSKNTVTRLEKERSVHTESITKINTALQSGEHEKGLQIGNLRKFDIRPEDFGDVDTLEDDVTDYKRNDIPVIQEGEASPSGFTWDAESQSATEFERMSRPYDFRETGAYAIVLRGDSMEPLLKRGMRLIISVTKPIGDGDLAYVQLKSGERLAKIATRMQDGWLLSSANPAHGPRTVRNDEIEHIHKVAYVRFLK